MIRWPVARFLLGLSLCTLGGTMLYIYLTSKDEEDELYDQEEIEKKKKDVSIEITISNEVIPIVVGRGGANIKMIETETGTVIRFREKDDENQYCKICGTQESVEQAKALLLKEVDSSPIVNEEIFVPQSACGKIIGRCGESLQEICRISHAKVSVDSGDRSSGNDTRRVVISGNRKQVNTAKKLIQDKINEDIELRKSIEESEQKREPRRSPTNSLPSSTHSSMTSLSPQILPSTLNVDDDGNPMEIYVSAIASPSKFWVQMVGSQTTQLDELNETMTEYYGNEENREKHRIADPYLGQIVAALFKYDAKWYRAEIVGILPNEFNPRDVVLDLYFVDYGDSEYVAPNEVFELRTDFLALRFQAIECFLAEVKPSLPTDSGAWDQQSIARFEELTHVASWKRLTSRIVCYKERTKRGNADTGSTPVPGLRMYDTSEGVKINIGDTLIAEGYAIRDVPTKSSSKSQSPEVLRLGGGTSQNRSESNSTQHLSFERDEQPNQISADLNQNREEKLMNSGMLSPTNRKRTTLDIDLDNSKHGSQNFLNAEKLNGNVLQDNNRSNNKIDTNSKGQWNRLVQS